MRPIPEYLKPCPFCGGKAELKSYKVDNEYVAMITCLNYCGGFMSTDNLMTLDDEDDITEVAAKNRVIRAWNNRIKKEPAKGSQLLTVFDN